VNVLGKCMSQRCKFYSRLLLTCAVNVNRGCVGADDSSDNDDVCPEVVAQSVFRDLIFCASFGKINDVIQPVIR